MDSSDKFEAFLDSKWFQRLAAVIGVAAAITKLLDLAQPKLVQPTATVFLLLIGLYAVRTVYKKLLRRLFWEDAERTYQYTSARYGMGYRKLEVECIIWPDGSARVRREVEVEAHSRIDRLDTFLLIPTLPSSGESWDMESPQVNSLSPSYNVSIAKVFPQQGRLVVFIDISPQLVEKQRLEYEMKERLPSGLYAIDLSEDELAEREDYDYFGWTINRPTRKLSLRIYFPEAKPDSFEHQVSYAPAAPGIPTDSSQLEEQKSLAPPKLEGPDGGRYVLKFDVEYPMIGLIYILRWRPLKSH